MKLGNWFRAGEWVRVVFGTGHLDRLVVFECKYLFGIYFNKWNVIEHDRFHTHAFPAISIGVRGSYQEEVLGAFDGLSNCRIDTYQAPWIRFIPRDHNHRMLKSTKDAMSITIAGPWDRFWSETFLDGSKRILSWGRHVALSTWPGDK